METEISKIIKKLKAEIPYKWRVQSFSKKKPQGSCVAYIDSRDVQDVLDENCEWSDRYYEVDGKLFCEITIYADGREYKRSDTGSESQAEAQKFSLFNFAFVHLKEHVLGIILVGQL